MDFGYVLKRAWEIISKFKVLWIFGILASCGQASGSGGGNSGYRFSSNQNNISPQIERFFAQLSPTTIALLIVLAVIVVLALIVIAILLGTIGRVGLIRGTVKAEQGAEHLTFAELWRDGLTYFWRVFGLNLLIGVTILIVVLVIFFPGAVLVGLTRGLFVLCLIPLVCVLIPVFWAVSVIIEQANVAMVVENLGITEAIKRGWKVVWSNIGSMIVMSLFLILVVGLIGGIIIALPLFVVALPALAGFANGNAPAIRNGLIASGVLFIVYLPFLLLLSGVLRAYSSSAWTLTYLRLTTKPSTQQPGAISIPENIETPPTPSV
jgi:hypothetical protein